MPLTSLIFLDTEFTNFRDPHLLALGMAGLDGQEFYAELDLQSEEADRARLASSEFVLGPQVLGQWGCIPRRAMSSAQIGEQAGQWLSDQIERSNSADASGAVSLTICSDSDTDLKLLTWALRNAGSWASVAGRIKFQNIQPMLATARADLAAQRCFESLAQARGLRPHHALADALALRDSFQAVVQPVPATEGVSQ